MNLVRLWNQHSACEEYQKFSNRHGRANKHIYVLAMAGDLHPLCEAWKFRGKIQRGDAVNVTFLSRAMQEEEEREFAIVQLDKLDLYGRRA